MAKDKLKAKSKKGDLGKAENAGEFTSWDDLTDRAVLLVGVYASDTPLATKFKTVENPIHADVVVFDNESRQPIKVFRDNNFFEGVLARRILNDADEGLGGSMGVVVRVPLDSGQHTYNLEEAPKALRKAIVAFYESDAIVAGKHGWTVDKKVAKKINEGAF